MSHINAVCAFTVGRHIPGAAILDGVLEFKDQENKVLGTGTLTQAVNPPINSDEAFDGECHVTGAGKTEMFVNLTGSALPPLLGAPHITKMDITIDGMWGAAGHASYTYASGTEHRTVKDAPVTIEWLKKPH